MWEAERFQRSARAARPTVGGWRGLPAPVPLDASAFAKATADPAESSLLAADRRSQYQKCSEARESEGGSSALAIPSGP